MLQAETQLSVLVVEDDDDMRGALSRYLRSVGCEVRAVPTITEGREELERGAADMALVDYQLPDGYGDELIRWALDHGRATSACCMTARASCGNVVQAMRAGSFDVLEKPFHLERLGAIVAARRPTSPAALHAWRRAHASTIIGDDPALQEVLTVAHNVADSDCTVLISGETGTGKELLARALHDASPRAAGAFVAINCGAIAESVIESELFGHVRGAFTGAVAARDGALVTAHGGTLFLDEIGDMPLAAQVRLLRVIQERKVTPVGADRPVAVDVRIIAATHCDLDAMVEAGTFRSDLFYRLSVIRIEMPTLRERPSDVLPLARHFLAQHNRRSGRSCTGFDEAAEEAMVSYGWKGNVRELAQSVERAVLMRRTGRITEKDLQLTRRSLSDASRHTPTSVPSVSAVMAPPALPGARSSDESFNLKDAINEIEKRMIQQALERTGGNRAEAAALLGLNRTTLVEKIRKLG